MGILSRKSGGGEEQGGGEDAGLRLDLDVRYCARCRRELLPWQPRCPDDGGDAVRASELPSREDTLLAHLDLDTGDDETGA